MDGWDEFRQSSDVRREEPMCSVCCVAGDGAWVDGKGHLDVIQTKRHETRGGGFEGKGKQKKQDKTTKDRLTETRQSSAPTEFWYGQARRTGKPEQQ